jgi:hypothetical protein
MFRFRRFRSELLLHSIGGSILIWRHCGIPHLLLVLVFRMGLLLSLRIAHLSLLLHILLPHLLLCLSVGRSGICGRGHHCRWGLLRVSMVGRVLRCVRHPWWILRRHLGIMRRHMHINRRHPLLLLMLLLLHHIHLVRHLGGMALCHHRLLLLHSLLLNGRLLLCLGRFQLFLLFLRWSFSFLRRWFRIGLHSLLVHLCHCRSTVQWLRRRCDHHGMCHLLLCLHGSSAGCHVMVLSHIMLRPCCVLRLHWLRHVVHISRIGRHHLMGSAGWDLHWITHWLWTTSGWHLSSHMPCGLSICMRTAAQ